MIQPVLPLATYAVHPSQSPGRAYPESPDPFRLDFELDRHRVIHSAAFRRLEYKTQVFVTHEGDHHRTRLTHSLEVAHLAMELAGALGVNALLAEVIALAHDLGHTPYGHAGEATLADRMGDHGGFEHNRQSLRIVEYLEHPYPAFRGLNLMAETRECLAAHCTIYDHPSEASPGNPTALLPPMEGQINNVADRLAYDAHDIEDALGAGLLTEDDLGDLRLWREAARTIRETHPHVSVHAVRRPILDAMILRIMTDVTDKSRRRVAELNPQSVEDVRRGRRILVGPSAALQEELAELEHFMLQRVYRHPRVTDIDTRARLVIGEVFDALVEKPHLMPPRFSRRVEASGAHRVVCDYVAGMTDRFLEAEHKRLFG